MNEDGDKVEIDEALIPPPPPVQPSPPPPPPPPLPDPALESGDILKDVKIDRYGFPINDENEEEEEDKDKDNKERDMIRKENVIKWYRIISK